jgi:hypothetical protein
MKYEKQLLALASVCMAIQPTTTLAFDPVYEGDVVLAFYQVVGGAVQPNTYVINIGQGSLYRENTSNNVSLSTINSGLASSNILADLDERFGDSWADSGTVYWVLVGGVSQGGTPDPYFVTEGAGPSGDPARTCYFSRPRTTLNTNSSGAGTTVANISATNRGSFANAITPFLTGYNHGTGIPALSLPPFQTNTTVPGTINAAAATFPITNSNTVEKYLPPALTTPFGIPVANIQQQLMGAGPIGGTAGVEGALDIYRVIDTTAGADLTHGASPGNAVVGTPKYVGTISLSASGDLKMTAIPSAGSYTTWASANGIPGELAGGDFDKDGLTNFTEYALAGLNPTVPNASPGTFTGNLLSFSKRPDAVANNDVTYAIQESDDLGILDPWTVVTPTSNTSSVITYQLPAGSPRKFARLRLLPNP